MDKDTIELLKNNQKAFNCLDDHISLMLNELSDYETPVRFDFEEMSRGGNWVQTDDQSFYGEKTYRLRPDYAEPSIVEYSVYSGSRESLWYNQGAGGAKTLDEAIKYTDFIGFKYEDGMVSPLPRLYKGVSNGKEFCTEKEWQEYMDEDFKVLTPTHVLFSKC